MGGLSIGIHRLIMLAGPQPSKKKSKKPVATRSRAQTDFDRQSASNTAQKQQPQKAQDDLLDLFGSFASTNNNNTNNAHEDTANSADPFGDDPFGDNFATIQRPKSVSIEKK